MCVCVYVFVFVWVCMGICMYCICIHVWLCVSVRGRKRKYECLNFNLLNTSVDYVTVVSLCIRKHKIVLVFVICEFTAAISRPIFQYLFTFFTSPFPLIQSFPQISPVHLPHCQTVTSLPLHIIMLCPKWYVLMALVSHAFSIDILRWFPAEVVPFEAKEWNYIKGRHEDTLHKIGPLGFIKTNSRKNSVITYLLVYLFCVKVLLLCKHSGVFSCFKTIYYPNVLKTPAYRPSIWSDFPLTEPFFDPSQISCRSLNSLNATATARGNSPKCEAHQYISIRTVSRRPRPVFSSS